jgi:hypothetical protein
MHIKEWLHLRVTSHISHIQNIQKGLSKSDTPTTKATCLVVVLHIVCNGVILHIISTCIQRSSIYTVVVVATSV